MSASILYDRNDVPLPTPRPDAFWCELVRVFAPNKSKETGDNDPYGAGAIELTPEHAEDLRKMIAQNWGEAYELWKNVSEGATIWIRREP